MRSSKEIARPKPSFPSSSSRRLCKCCNTKWTRSSLELRATRPTTSSRFSFMRPMRSSCTRCLTGCKRRIRVEMRSSIQPVKYSWNFTILSAALQPHQKKTALVCRSCLTASRWSSKECARILPSALTPSLRNTTASKSHTVARSKMTYIWLAIMGCCFNE